MKIYMLMVLIGTIAAMSHSTSTANRPDAEPDHRCVYRARGPLAGDAYARGVQGDPLASHSGLTQGQHGAPAEHRFRLGGGNPGVVIEHKPRQQRQRGAACLRRPHQNADRRLSRLGMDRQDGDRAERGFERADDIGETVRPPDQSERSARTQ